MRLCVATCCLWLAAMLAAGESPMLFHHPLDQAPAGATQVEGKMGKAIVAPAAGVRLPTAGHLDKRRGTLCLWVRPNWDGVKYVNHGFVADEIDFNRDTDTNFYLWHWCVGRLRFDIRVSPSSNVAFDVKAWRAGEWHHVAAAWDCTQGIWLFIDGRLVAHRKFTWTPRTVSHFRLGTNWTGRNPADAALDDLRIYGRVLDAGHVALAMQGKPLPMVEYKGLAAPDRVAEGQPFEVGLKLGATQGLVPDARMSVSLGGFVLGTFPVGRPAQVTVPRHLHLGGGAYTLSVKVVGALATNPAPTRQVTLVAATRPSPPRWAVERGTVMLNGRPAFDGDAGLLVGTAFYTGKAATAKARDLLRSGTIADAIPCRLLDEVDCTTASHSFAETGPSRLVELTPGTRYRVACPPKAVTQTRHIYKRDRKVLPTYSYRLRTTPRPTPHLLVVESANDCERNLEVAIDAARGSQPSAVVAETGMGTPRLVNLAVVCAGREFPATGKPFRQAFLFYPKSDAVEVSLCASQREMDKPDAPGSAVSRMAVYEIARPLAELANPVEPPAKPRHLALFYPAVMLSFREYGFSGATPEHRRSSVRALCDYLRFLGFDRLEFHPYPFNRKAHFRSAVYPRAGEEDVFDDILPVAQAAGIGVVPRMDSLCFYGDAWKNEPINYQLTKDGKTPTVFGKCPDPLRPPVQKLLLDMLGDMLDRCKGYSCVQGVGFRANAKFGVLYVGGRQLNTPAQDNGYSAWDIEAFERDTATRVAAPHTDPKACHAWLKANAWDKWIDWRCRKMREWWLRARDLARSHGGKKLFVRSVIPYTHHQPSDQTQWYGHKVPPLALCRHHGLDPRLFHADAGMFVSEYFALGADRYNTGRVHNRAWWHDPRLDGLFHTAEGSEIELYNVYWELPTHPKGFRVGPSQRIGRANFEPFTHALRTRNPYGFVFYNWHRATTGIDLELRELARAYRGLPAVAPRRFDGRCRPEPDERLWVRWFGDRLAVVNDSPEPRTVRLTIRNRKGREVYDLATCRTVGRRHWLTRRFGVRLALRPYDIRTLVVR